MVKYYRRITPIYTINDVSRVSKVNIIVDAIPSDNNTYFGVVEFDDIPVYGASGETGIDVYSKLNKWLQENYELVKRIR